MKTWWRATAIVSIGLLAWGGAAVAKDKDAKRAGCDQPSASVNTSAPERIDGQVVAIDQQNGMVTIKGSDGQTHQFRGNQETLKDLKVGDRLEAKLRSAPSC